MINEDKKMENRRKGYAVLILLLVLYVSSLTVYTMVRAEPEGASLDYKSNSTKSASSPANRTDDKGYIHVLTLETIQQNIKWKAYVGNVSGTLVLRDADDYSIYEWPSGGAPDGEVYITRNSTIDWSTIQCANDTEITQEQNSLGHAAAAADNINNTFSSNLHEQFDVGENTISSSTCKSMATWVNNTAQTMAEDALFQEVLLMDTSERIVYASLIDQDTSSYRDDGATTNITYDFQAIIPDIDGAGVSTYYFYVEISG